MRCLMSFAGGFGHAAPLFPVARALAVYGHDIAFTGQPSVLEAVAAAGFRPFDSGGAMPELKPVSHALFQPFDPDGLRDRIRVSFGGYVARDRLAGVAGVANHWRPDLLVCDEMDFGAMLAMEQLGVPHISVSVIASGRLVTADWFAAAVDGIRAEQGLPADPDLAMVGRHLTLSPFPAALRDPACPPYPHTVYFRSDAPTAPGIDRRRPPGRPRVYATFGTEFGMLAADLFSVVLRGLAQLDIEVVATVGTAIDPASFGQLPERCQVLRFVDQTALLPSCDLMVSHGGSGSMLGGLTHGIPMLLLPMGADQPFNAERATALGFGRSIDPRTATPDSVAAAAQGLLHDAPSRRAAADLRQAIVAQSAIGSLVPMIEQVALRSH